MTALRRLSAAAVLCLAPLASLGAQQAARSDGWFIGSLRSSTTERGVAAAEIRVVYIDSVSVRSAGETEVFLDSSRARVTLSDTSGDFYIRSLDAGKYTVSIRRLGFAPFDGVLTVDSGVVELHLALTQVAAVLPPVTVNVAAGRIIEQLDRVGFTERRRSGMGQYLERKDVLKATEQSIAELLEHKGIFENAQFFIDRIPVDWETLQNWPAELFIGAEVYRRRASLPQAYNGTRRTANVFSRGGQAALNQPTVLIWTSVR